MKKIKYPLIVSDCDGTILRSDNTIGDFTKEKINEYVKDGGVFAVSTGRMITSILAVVRSWGLKGIVSAFQGALLMDIQTEEILHQCTMPHETALMLCKEMEKLNLHIHTYTLREIFSNRDNEWLKVYERIAGEKAIIQPNMSEFMKSTKMCPYKLLAMVEPADSKRICEALESVLPPECFVTVSAPFLVEIGLKSATKEKAVTFLSNYYNVPIEKTIAIGDQPNDIPMIAVAGLGIAVKNAHEDVKKVAYTLPYTNDEDAVGKMIDEIAYTEE